MFQSVLNTPSIKPHGNLRAPPAGCWYQVRIIDSVATLVIWQETLASVLVWGVWVYIFCLDFSFDVLMMNYVFFFNIYLRNSGILASLSYATMLHRTESVQQCLYTEFPLPILLYVGYSMKLNGKRTHNPAHALHTLLKDQLTNQQTQQHQLHH